MWLKLLRSVLYGLVVVLLAGIALVAGIVVAEKTEKPPPLEMVNQLPPEQRAAAKSLLEQALAARLAGNHREALARLEDVRAQDTAMRGLDYQFAQTQPCLDSKCQTTDQTCQRVHPATARPNSRER